MTAQEKSSPNPFRRATAIAVSVLLLGLAASIAGNIQSILLEDGDHGIGSMISAVWWPFILFLMIEIAIHTPWAKTKMDRVAQWAGAGVIGFLAFYISYFHLAHVLSSFGYDRVSRYLGPLAVDTAMMVATYALNRVGVARRALATEDLATAKAKELATMATEMATALVGHEEAVAMATEDLATEDLATEPVATPVASGQEASLADDWSDLEGDLDRELAEMTAASHAAPEPAPTEEAGQGQETSVRLTAVPAEAAKVIRAALEADANAPAVAVAQVLVERGLASTDRTGRRYVAAIKNGTARVN